MSFTPLDLIWSIVILMVLVLIGDAAWKTV
jgi:hypothetical protein